MILVNSNGCRRIHETNRVNALRFNANLRRICEIRELTLGRCDTGSYLSGMKSITEKLPFLPSMPWFETTAMLLLIAASHLR